MKLLMYIAASLICPSINAMRAPRVARIRTPNVRAFHNVRPAGLPPFKVASKPHLDKYVQPIVSKMSEDEKYHYRQLHASIQFWAIEARLDTAAEKLEKLSDITKSLVLDQVDENGQTMLIKAAKAGYHGFIGFLLQQQANAAVADNEGLTALSINPARLTKFLTHHLLESGVNVTATDIHKRQALHYLAKKQALSKARVQNIGFHMSVPDFSIYEKTNGDVARMLIPEGADMYARDKSGKTPIYYAQVTEHIEMLKAFIDCGAKRDDIIEKASDLVKQELVEHCKLY